MVRRYVIIRGGAAGRHRELKKIKIKNERCPKVSAAALRVKGKRVKKKKNPKNAVTSSRTRASQSLLFQLWAPHRSTLVVLCLRACIEWSRRDGLCCTTFTKKNLVAAPAWRSLPSSVSNDSFHYANTSTCSGRRRRRRDKQRLALWDMWFNVSGQMLRYFAVWFTQEVIQVLCFSWSVLN